MADTKRYIDDTGLEHIAKAMDGKFATNAELKSHTGNADNPHNVTASQVGVYTKETTDRKYETQADSESNATLFGFLTRPGGVHTLQFYRPGAALNPDPIYELPVTTFDGTQDIINTGYRLFSQAGTSGALAEWTFFCNVIENSNTVDQCRLVRVAALTGGTAGFSCCIRITNYNGAAVRFVSNNAIDDILPNSPTGKVAFRRSGNSVYHSADGYNWTCYQSGTTLTSSGDILYIGGAQPSDPRKGKGTISCKLWDKSLDNISELF